ncbi:hypothetical protein LEP1GSC202_0499 [Leptospira yanagawae serovar Saopaulo str. Sao Paulo = ATCC 700523]|uniref:Uncharacterized protein n=1 Tax=Leptospira yanagawae serovar Saopaulo str. Sao Paulo = ATCC 700523 TaxID=1249483 RepID=A0A5E8HF99_9LEPT|nr:hypothetical protein LEP1GSC202_0499 [Leptospira yanagawae serovar Saopaulo str. Sao Paulo = ATCC 700523]
MVGGSHWVAGGHTPPNQGGDTNIQSVPPQKKSPHSWRLPS